MNRIFLLFKREIKRYFDSPLAYITIIVFLIISGWMFSSTIFLINRVTIHNFIVNVPLLLIFFAPAIAMQLLANEFHTGTIEVLGSLPIRDSEIIAGKFLAAFTLLTSSIILTLIFPISISFLGNLDWGQVAGAYAGMILIGGIFLMAGLFASSISANQVVAFIIGFAMCFTFFIIGKFTAVIPAYIRPVINYIGIDSHWENLSRGVIDIRDIIYFLSLCVFFFYGTLVSFCKRVHMGIYKAFSITLLFGILVIFNILTSTLVVRFDLTENSIYSLSKASKKVAKTLKDPVIIKAYFSKNLPEQYQASRKYLNDILHEYSAYSNSKIKFKFLDPSLDESIAREAMVNGIPPLKFTETGRGKFEIKQGYMGIIILYGDKKEVMPVVENISGLEYDLTTRIKKITMKEQRTIGYIGKSGIPDNLMTNIMTRYNFTEIESTDSLDKENITSVIVNVSEEFSEKELNILKTVAGKKIPLGIFADKYKINMESFSAQEIDVKINDFLSEYGLKIGKGLILDRQNQRIGVTTQQGMFTIQNIVNYPYFPLITDLDTNNPVTRDLNSISFPFISPIVIDEEKSKNYEIDILAKTSKRSWLDENPRFMSPMREYYFDNQTACGPFPIICLLKEKDTSFRIILTSNSRFLKRDFMTASTNESLFLNVIDWLAEDYDFISIRSKGITDRPFKNISNRGKTLVKYMDIFLIPLLVLGTGIYRWKSRDLRNLRKKQILLGD